MVTLRVKWGKFMAKMQVLLLDLSRYYERVLQEWLGAVAEITSSGQVLDGSYKKLFEEEFAQYLGVKYVVGVSSGTDALILSLRALGIGHGDEVITHANTFISVINAIVAVGATPVLADMSWEDFGPDRETLCGAFTHRTKAIIVCHLLGAVVNLDPILRIATAKGVPVVEDVAHSPGARYGRYMVGTLGMINAFSFGPLKNLPALGDAGAVATNDCVLYEFIESLANYGREAGKRNEYACFGVSARMDEIQAAWLRIGLRTLEERNTRREDIYEQYCYGLRGLNGVRRARSHDKLVFHKAPFFLAPEVRNRLAEHLGKNGISTGVHYPQPIHKTRAWRDRGFPSLSLPNAEEYSSTELSFPIFPEMTDEEVEYVINGVKSFFDKQ